MVTEEELTLQDFLLEALNSSLEDKIIRAHEKPAMSDREITEVVQRALSEFPEGVLTEDDTDEIFDIIYETIEHVLERVKL